MPIIPLSEMSVGQKGLVSQVTGQGEVYHRLLEMGLTQGTPVEVIRFAPLGDPIDIKVRGYHLSVRRREADVIRVLME